jgi:superfamily II DNA or RNA helicase
LNPKKGNPLEVDWPHRWGHLKDKTRKVIINCTQAEYYGYVSQKIDWMKNQYFRMRQEYQKNLWLQKSGERLKWLSAQKDDVVKHILSVFGDKRTLTFCSSIQQTENLGRYCINNKNTDSEEVLQQFNEGNIDHITACNMLNEGMNLKNCQVGIYANLNASEVIVKQRLGRILRHRDPVIVIPYFFNTRDEELVQKMMADYNPELVTTVTSIEQLKRLI